MERVKTLTFLTLKMPSKGLTFLNAYFLNTEPQVYFDMLFVFL